MPLYRFLLLVLLGYIIAALTFCTVAYQIIRVLMR